MIFMINNLNNILKYAGFVVIAVVLCFLSGCFECPFDNSSSRVVYVYDGDTVRLASGEKVRYLGIDTPEMNYKRPPAEYLAEQAKDFNSRLVEGKNVRLEFDAQRRDKYGRLLAYVYVDDVFINKKLLEEGLAKVLVIPPNERYADEFVSIQRDARRKHKGIWSR